MENLTELHIIVRTTGLMLQFTNNYILHTKYNVYKQFHTLRIYGSKIVKMLSPPEFWMVHHLL